MEKYVRNSVLSRAESKKQMSKHKRVQNQAFMYVGAFLVTWFFPTLFQLVIVIAGEFPFPLLLLTAIFVPIQGLLNLIVFVRPTFIRYRRANPDINTIVAWFQMLCTEITGHDVQRAMKATSRKASSQGAVPDEFKKTFRISGLKPTLNTLSGVDHVSEDAEEEKEPEDAVLDDDEFDDNPNQTYDEEVSP
jgi:hypothetical protein